MNTRSFLMGRVYVFGSSSVQLKLTWPMSGRANGRGLGSPLLLVPFAFVNVRVISMVPGRVQLPLKSGLPLGSRGAGALGSNVFTFSLCAATEAGDSTSPDKTSAAVIITSSR